MIKVIEIIDANLYNITCKFNNGVIKTINIKPLIDNHKHLNGIEKLNNESVLKNVKIGVMGEIMWENLISIEYNSKITKWNYDISPEFAYYNC